MGNEILYEDVIVVAQPFASTVYTHAVNGKSDLILPYKPQKGKVLIAAGPLAMFGYDYNCITASAIVERSESVYYHTEASLQQLGYDKNKLPSGSYIVRLSNVNRVVETPFMANGFGLYRLHQPISVTEYPKHISFQGYKHPEKATGFLAKFFNFFKPKTIQQ